MNCETDSERQSRILSLVGQLLNELGVDPTDRATIKALGDRHRRKKRQLTISKLCWKYVEYADGYYLRPEGSSAHEGANIELALRPLRRLYGRQPVTEFGPLKLKAVRDEMVKAGWCRRQINHQIGRIKRMFRWATENEIVPASILHAIASVAGLKQGRTPAPDHDPVRPAPDDLVEAVLPFVSKQVKAMIQLQLLTGMRPGEVTMMRAADIDQSNQPWAYRPARHKTQHHGHARTIFLGPQAQEIVRPFLLHDKPQAYLFRPADADADRRERLRLARKTPMSCGNRAGTNVKRRPRRFPGERYQSHSYARAIAYGCRHAFPLPVGLSKEDAVKWRRDHHWHPHQLRHNAATRFRREFGLDAAQVLLGHKTLEVTQVYAEKDADAARQVMLKVG